MKRNAFQQHDGNSTKKSRNKIVFEKTKLEEVSVQSNSCVKFLKFCRKNANKKLQDLNESG